MKKQGPSVATIYVGKLYECTAGACTKHIFAGDRRVASVTATSKRYYHADHLGSTRVVTDQTGTPVESIFYRPFGEAQADSASGNSRHKFTGQEYDPETGLYFYNARYYNPSLGRFVSADTIVRNIFQPQDLNRYSYVANNPINRIDPSGHAWFGLSIFAFFAEAICAGSVICGVAVGTVAVVASAVAVVKAAGGQTPLDRIDFNKLGNWATTNVDKLAGAVKQAGDWVGRWFGRGGAPGSSGAPLGGVGALEHFTYGRGQPVTVPFDQLSADVADVRVEDFPRIARYIEGSREGNTTFDISVSDTKVFQTTGLNNQATFGQVTLRIDGTLTASNGSFYFDGRLSALPDYYNFDPKPAGARSWIGERSTESGARYGGAVGGKPFTIEFTGSTPMSGTRGAYCEETLACYGAQ